MPIKISPSLLSADFTRLAEAIRLMENHQADMLHLDIMDGHFVPNITFGPPVVASIRKVTRLFLDAHLMVTDPDRFIAPLIQAGADRVVFHYEAVANPEALLKKIQSSGKENGLSIKPATPFSAIKKWLPILDCILVMTVEPGFGGQPFMSEMLPKIREIKDCIRRAQSKTLIAVDGGINLETARLAAEAGADILIAGAAIFNAPDPGYVMRELKALG